MSVARPNSKARGNRAERNRDGDAFRLIAMGASLGGVESLTRVVERLPGKLRAAVLIVLHVQPGAHSFLPEILSRANGLPAAHARDGEAIRPGRIYVAPPDRHMLVKGSRIVLSHGPHENSTRPAIDPLFRTAARSFGPRVIGVVLSGSLDDGTVGLMDIKANGGVAVVQDPQDAIGRGMPESALRHVKVDHVKPLKEIGPLLTRLAREPLPQIRGSGAMAEPSANGRARKRGNGDPDIAEYGSDALATSMADSPPSPFTCPDCGGVLWEFDGDGLLRYRCHVGHGFTADALVAAQSQKLEDALWTALRALEEAAGTRRRMAERARRTRMEHLARGYAEGAEKAERQAAVLREVLVEKPSARVSAPGAREAERRAKRAHDRSASGPPQKRNKPGRRRAKI